MNEHLYAYLNEWVRECKSMGMCIHRFAPGKSVVLSGY